MNYCRLFAEEVQPHKPALRAYKSDRLLGDLESLRVVEDGSNAAETASREQEIEILHEAIANLPPRCREILQLRRFDGLSLLQISEKLGISTHTVDAHLCMAVFRCRRYLLERGVSRERLGSICHNPTIAVQE